MKQKTSRSRKSNNSRGPGTRERILNAALEEFADRGYSGARVDRIAAAADTSKHMIYYHFKSKKGLYEAVLEETYLGIRFSEADIDVDNMDPIEALKSIVRQSFDYHCSHENFVRLVMNENIHRAEHIPQELIQPNRPIMERLSKILGKGARLGVLRSDIDPVQLHMTISALGFHYVSNKYSFSKLFELDMRSPAAKKERRELAVEIVLKWCSAA